MNSTEAPTLLPSPLRTSDREGLAELPKKASMDSQATFFSINATSQLSTSYILLSLSLQRSILWASLVAFQCSYAMLYFLSVLHPSM